MTALETTINVIRLRAYRLYYYVVQMMIVYGGCSYTSTVSRVITYCIAGLAIVTCFTNMLNIFNFCYQHRHNLLILTKALGRSITRVAVIVKVSSFLWHRDCIIKFHPMLYNFFEEELAQDEQTKKLVLSRIKYYCILTSVQFITVTWTLLGIMYPSLANIVRQVIHQEMPQRYGMPMQLEYPWPLPDGFLYHVHYLCELICIWFLIFTTCGVEGLFGLYTYQISMVLRAMSFRLMDPLSVERFPQLLRRCVEKHKQLLRCKDSLQSLYGPIIFWPIITNAVTMCALIYETVLFSDLSIGSLAHIVPYMMAKLLQTFMYTWYGTNIITASEEFRQAIYCSKWPDAIDEKGLRTHMILTMMQESMSIRALKICSASMGTFVSVLNTAISYFFLLQSLGQRE